MERPEPVERLKVSVRSCTKKNMREEKRLKGLEWACERSGISWMLTSYVRVIMPIDIAVSNAKCPSVFLSVHSLVTSEKQASTIHSISLDSIFIHIIVRFGWQGTIVRVRCSGTA